MSVNTVNSDGSLLRVAGGTLYADAPIGTIVPFGGSTVPSGYLLCNGAEVLKTTYAELYTVIGDAFGTASDNTKFVLPDLRETTPVGSGTRGDGVAMHDVYTLGQFKDDQLQEHKHTFKNPTISGKYGAIGAAGGTLYSFWNTQSSVDTATFTASGGEVNNVFNARKGLTTHGKQLGVNYIIKAKQIAAPADFTEAIDDALNAFAKPITLQPLNNSTINFDKSRIVGGIVTVCADIVVQSGSCLTKENAIANVPNLGTASIGYVLPCLYRNTVNGVEEPSFAVIQTAGNLYPYYTKAEYNQIRINASYSSKI